MSEGQKELFGEIEPRAEATLPKGNGLQATGDGPLKELMDGFAEAGGTIYVCSPCFKKRGLDEDNLVAGAKIVGGAKLVEFMGEGVPSISY